MLADDTTAAAQHLADAVDALRRSGASNELAKALTSQAALRHAQGDISGARAALAEGRVIFEELGTLDEPKRVRDALAMLDVETSPDEHVDNPEQA
jgi:hypothetical protein